MIRRNNSEKPIIVLVHGAFAESSSWDDVIQHLQAQGYTTLTVLACARFEVMLERIAFQHNARR
jgi:hypothetical protein